MAKVTSQTGIVLTVTVALLAAASFSFAQQTPAQTSDDQKPVDTLKVNVNVVQLFFNVKDKKGGLIPNLTKGDFEIYENGQKREITNLYEVRAAATPPQAATTQSATPAPAPIEPAVEVRH